MKIEALLKEIIPSEILKHYITLDLFSSLSSNNVAKLLIKSKNSAVYQALTTSIILKDHLSFLINVGKTNDVYVIPLTEKLDELETSLQKLSNTEKETLRASIESNFIKFSKTRLDLMVKTLKSNKDVAILQQDISSLQTELQDANSVKSIILLNNKADALFEKLALYNKAQEHNKRTKTTSSYENVFTLLEEKSEFNSKHLIKLNDCLASVFRNSNIKFVFEKLGKRNSFRLNLNSQDVDFIIQKEIAEIFKKSGIPAETKTEFGNLVIDIDCTKIGKLMEVDSKLVATELKKRFQKTAEEYYQTGVQYESAKKTSEAFEQYQHAITFNHMKAKTNLGIHYISSLKDYKMGNALLLEAANQGHARAQFNLGKVHEKGLGVTANLNEAHKWYKMAAESGDKNFQAKFKEIENKLYSSVASKPGTPQL